MLKIPSDRRQKLLNELEHADKVDGGDSSNDDTGSGGVGLESGGAGCENSEGSSAAAVTQRKKKKAKDTDLMHSLFDICSCKCSERATCKCPKERKVLASEWDFLQDQRADRNMTIGGVDKKVSEAWHNNDIRKEAFVKQAIVEEIRCDNMRKDRAEALTEFMDFEQSEHYEVSTNNDEDFLPETASLPSSSESSNQNRLNLPCFIAEVDRYQISDRAAAALATGLLKDLGKISDTDKSLVLDRYKVRRDRKSRQKERKKKKKEESSGGIKCIGFDGKKDKNTKVLEEVEINGNIMMKQASKSEEHIVFVEEPSGKYLDHVSVDEGKGTGRDIGHVITDLLGEYDSTESLEAVCADGTAVNTGYRSGAIAELERNLGRPLYWNICLKHCNELPLRHVFDNLDGGFGTSGPNSFKGDLGKEIAGDIHLQSVVAFDKIGGILEDIPDTVFEDLSRDQKLLFRYAKAIIAGEVPSDLKDQKPGPLCHSRWLTLALKTDVPLH